MEGKSRADTEIDAGREHFFTGRNPAFLLGATQSYPDKIGPGVPDPVRDVLLFGLVPLAKGRAVSACDAAPRKTASHFFRELLKNVRRTSEEKMAEFRLALGSIENPQHQFRPVNAIRELSICRETAVQAPYERHPIGHHQIKLVHDLSKLRLMSGERDHHGVGRPDRIGLAVIPGQFQNFRHGSQVVSHCQGLAENGDFFHDRIGKNDIGRTWESNLSQGLAFSRYGRGSQSGEEAVRFFQGEGYHLIHIVIVVGGKAADEAGVGFGGGGETVFFVLDPGIRGGNGIVGLVGGIGGEGVFPDDIGVGSFLTGDVFDFNDAGVGFVVGIVDLESRLPMAGFSTDGLAVGGGELVSGKGFDLKIEATVREVAVDVVEIGVDRARVDRVARRILVPGGEEIGIEMDLQTGRGGDHALEEAGEAVAGKGLEFFPQIVVVTGGADRDAGTDRGVEVAGVAVPLLERVVFEKELVKRRASIGEDDLFTVGGSRIGNAFPLQPIGELSFGGRVPDELFVGGKVDRKGPVLAVGMGFDAIVGGCPVGEAAEVFADSAGVGPEIMGAVTVVKDAIFIRGVVGVAPQVVTTLKDDAF